jgi:hypothetical protein
MWFLTQHKRWGLLKEHPDYLAVAQQINQLEHLQEAAAALKVKRAQGGPAQHQMIDGTVWDGKDPKEVRRELRHQGIVRLNPRATRSPRPWSVLSFIRRSKPPRRPRRQRS